MNEQNYVPKAPKTSLTVAGGIAIAFVLAIGSFFADYVSMNQEHDSNIDFATNKNTDTSDLFTFVIDGKAYQLPEKISDFTDDGWTYADASDATVLLATGETEYIDLNYMGTTDARVTFFVTNFSMNALEVQECYVTEIDFFNSTVNRLGMELSFHNGDLTLDTSTRKDVEAIYGYPDYIYNGDSSNSTIAYYLDHNDENYNSSVSFNFGNSDSTLSYVIVRNETEPADLEKVEISDEAPEYLSLYQAPSSLGNDFLSGNIEIEGKTYNIPVPLQTLLDDGWSYGSDEQNAFGAGEGYSLTLVKDDKRIYATAYNMNTTATYIHNTIVTSITYYVSSYNAVDINLPGGISAASTYDDINALLKNNGITNYEYKKDYKYFKIPLDQDEKTDYVRDSYQIYIADDGSIDSIELTNFGWLMQ